MARISDFVVQKFINQCWSWPPGTAGAFPLSHVRVCLYRADDDEDVPVSNDVTFVP
jgi:hypothetical protein